MPEIKRSTGIIVGGYNPGGGYRGVTEELDNHVLAAAEFLAQRYGRDVEIRFNSDRRSGGAFLQGLGASVGINAKLWSLSDLRWFWKRWAGIIEGSFDDFCRARLVDPGGPEQQIAFGVYVDARYLRDQADATEGPRDSRYAYHNALTLQDAAAQLERLAAL